MYKVAKQLLSMLLCLLLLREHEFIVIDDLINSRNGFLFKDGTFSIEVTLKVWLRGAPLTNNFNFCSADRRHDVKLVVEGKDLFVNKEYFVVHSPFFEDLFSNKEPNKISFDLPEVTYKDMKELLLVIDPTAKEVDKTNYEDLLIVASKFQFDSVKDKVQRFVLASKMSKAEKLILADEHNLGVLMDILLSGFTLNAIKALRKDGFFEQFSTNLCSLLFENYLLSRD